MSDPAGNFSKGQVFPADDALETSVIADAVKAQYAAAMQAREVASGELDTDHSETAVEIARAALRAARHLGGSIESVVQAIVRGMITALGDVQLDRLEVVRACSAALLEEADRFDIDAGSIAVAIVAAAIEARENAMLQCKGIGAAAIRGVVAAGRKIGPQVHQRVRNALLAADPVFNELIDRHAENGAAHPR